MKIKTKLLVSFCVVIFVPLISIGVFILLLNHVRITEIQRLYNVEDEAFDYITNNFQFLYNLTSDEYKALTVLSTEELISDEYLDPLNAELQLKHSYILIRAEEDLIYDGSDGEETPRVLPAYDSSGEQSNLGTYIEDETNFFVKQYDFVTSDGTRCSAFLVTVAIEALPEWKELIFDLALCVGLIVLLTSILLGIWIYQGIVNPITRLQIAIQNIRDGNLDFSLDSEASDEIGDLSRSFEEMREQLKHSSEEKLISEKENKELIRNISHDLKTPITAIKGYAEGILDGVADTPEKRDRYLKTIYNKANEMTTLINELTLYSQIDANRIPYNFTKINVADYFNDCVEEIGMDLETKNIGLAYFNYVDEDTQIVADAEQLTRVVHNIISNSVKYLDKPKGFINVRIKDVGDYVQVEIEDNGKGIHAKDLPYIFDRFYRTDESRNSATGGSGIGLSIVHKIIEDHGGKIWATSKLETGTTMYFVLRKYEEVLDE